MEKAFTVWKFGGVQFLAFRCSETNVIVLDEAGNNYGSWITVDRFREVQQKGGELASPLPGCSVELSGRIVHANA